jgi:hypothetical protein
VAANDDDELRTQARKRLEKKSDFAAHCVSYVVVNLMLVGVWALTGQGYFWPVWVMLGWGVGLVLHAWDTYFRRPITEAEIDRELGRGQGG